MKKLTILTLLFILFLEVPLVAQNLTLKDYQGRVVSIPIIKIDGIEYISLSDFASSQSASTYYNSQTRKLVINLNGRKVTFSAYCSFVVIDDQVVHIPFPVGYWNNELLIPLVSFTLLSKEYFYASADYNPEKKILDYNPSAYNLWAGSIERKANGTIIRLFTGKNFPQEHIQSWLSDKGWLYVTIVDAQVDSTSFRNLLPAGVVKEIIPLQMEKSTQLTIKLKGKIESHEIYQLNDPSQLVISLRTPIKENTLDIQKYKSRWLIDTIVLDAGHGGKDPGCIGRGKLYEKDITLRIVLALGKMLEKEGLNVVYTRKTDVFVPLWQRTRIANESGGKLFISVHVNSHRNKNISGVETYLLRPGKTQDAIEVAERENSVIRLEDSGEQYKNFDNIQFILASLAQNAFMKESEDLAAMIQKNFSSELKVVNRGVKQAGFYVLVGASMPNALVEVGFISNPKEARKLKQKKYCEQIAHALYKSIMEFKTKYDQQIQSSLNTGS